METTPRHSTKRNFIILACIVFLFGFTVAAMAEAKVSTGEKQDGPSSPLEIKKSESVFEYQLEGRQDPFQPFISEKVTSNENLDEIIDENKVLTGMQLFEPGQLTLVALMKAGTSQLAMVQDFTGKGYVITEGTKICRRGVVASITDGKVLIEETAITRGGKTLKTQIAMVLKKEGEE